MIFFFYSVKILTINDFNFQITLSAYAPQTNVCELA